MDRAGVENTRERVEGAVAGIWFASLVRKGGGATGRNIVGITIFLRKAWLRRVSWRNEHVN